METAYFKSPICNIKITAQGDIIVSIEFCDEFWPSKPKGANLALCLDELGSYFAGNLREFSFEFELQGGEFAQSVYRALLDVPYAHTTTYAQIARKIGHPKACRAVGNANARNALPIVVPCHRIIASNGLGGYSGGLKIKKFLLNLEQNAKHAG